MIQHCVTSHSCIAGPNSNLPIMAPARARVAPARMNSEFTLWPGCTSKAELLVILSYYLTYRLYISMRHHGYTYNMQCPLGCGATLFFQKCPQCHLHFAPQSHSAIFLYILGVGKERGSGLGTGATLGLHPPPPGETQCYMYRHDIPYPCILPTSSLPHPDQISRTHPNAHHTRTLLQPNTSRTRF